MTRPRTRDLNEIELTHLLELLEQLERRKSGVRPPSTERDRRLAEERAALAVSFGHLEWVDDSLLTGVLRSEKRGYGIEVVLGPQWPWMPPLLYLVDELTDAVGQRFERASHAMHVQGCYRRGLVPCLPPLKEPSIVDVLTLARVWIFAYEVHLETGLTIDAVLAGWNPSLPT